ncbi:flavoprotein [Streptomonospora nanhaiensis]|uniref:flavoprotein n=1 Tax=Streptomonospora nanhaiensis TaxID=1323731 RepID=UPI001C391B50|nr:flavoprotein [Streptomonospora nanhaiensis]MBV2365982.1 flavoprotein [Streptomonospora nanhaiensis]MBX9388837.1 flavoprotein [Streptomonospora nanhaiensis]
MARMLYLVISAAPAPEGLAGLIESLHSTGWRVAVFSTPTGAGFHDLARIADLTGESVRVDYRRPGTGTPLAPADAVLACPLTFNSTNKFANGIADNFAISLLCEMVGYRVPTVVVPHCKPQLADHPAFQRALQTLRTMPAVTLLHDPDAPYEKRLPAWRDVVDAVHTATTGK